MAKQVRAPDGSDWKVDRAWMPERKTLWRSKRWQNRKRKRDGSDGFDVAAETGGGSGGGGSGGGWNFFSSDDIAGALLVIVLAGAVILAFFLLTTVVFPLIVIGIELLLVLLLFFIGLASRILFRKPWTVRARCSDGRHLEWHVRGFRASGRVRDEAAAQLSSGHTPTPSAPVERVS